ncbi:MAG: hypothetical protein J6M66_03185 [Lachnospiraceae bacterium]|nr:hypothetical protein [Lachnospiraceae bacterium]
MIYFICFLIAFVLLLLLFVYGKTVDVNVVILILVIVVGNGGYMALALSQNLNEAILANKITYVIGTFVPMILMLVVADICRVTISQWVKVLMYFGQILIYLSVVTIGMSDIFYETAEFHTGPFGAYLTKTYGFMHTVYIVTLISYTFISICIGLISLDRKTVVGRNNVLIILFVDFFTVSMYIMERFVHLNVELMPLIFTFGVAIILIPIFRIYSYSIYNNRYILEKQMSGTGYIIFDKDMRFMGCNDAAIEFYPELKDWELEVRIPGNGGRFNTFLRQNFTSYVENASIGDVMDKTYEYKERVVNYTIDHLMWNKKRAIGYVICINDMTSVVRRSDIPK